MLSKKDVMAVAGITLLTAGLTACGDDTDSQSQTTGDPDPACALIYELDGQPTTTLSIGYDAQGHPQRVTRTVEGEDGVAGCTELTTNDRGWVTQRETYEGDCDGTSMQNSQLTYADSINLIQADIFDSGGTRVGRQSYVYNQALPVPMSPVSPSIVFQYSTPELDDSEIEQVIDIETGSSGLITRAGVDEDGDQQADEIYEFDYDNGVIQQARVLAPGGDTPIEVIDYAYDSQGRLDTVTVPGGQLTAVYDCQQ